MAETITETEFPALFLQDVPLLDVRAPAEFAHGAVPMATNLPLLTDSERQQVGIRYKQAGREAAIALGHELVDDDSRQARIRAWRKHLASHDNAAIYCWRGGLRSRIAQQWLADSGLEVPRLAGGYKALRRFLLDTLATVARQAEFIIVAGKTGSGKTLLLNQIPFAVDLEGLASHRGSAFGRRTASQPTQVNFENRLAIAFLKLPYTRPRRIFLEDESRAIGSLSVPLELHRAMRNSPLAMVEESLDARIDTILNDYIESNYLEFMAAFPDRFEAEFAEFLLGSLQRIRRRLGVENHDRIADLMRAALATQPHAESLPLHREWIRKLLLDYYDPMYDYQLRNKTSPIVFRGNRAELLQWAASINRNEPGTALK